MVTIYLVRHAESIANTKGMYQGITYDTHLSDAGKKQAVALAERFADVPLNTILASPLTRTMQTALAVGRKKGLSVQPVPELLETNHGQWEGMKKTDIGKKWPHIYKKWQNFPSRVTFPGGERFVDTQKRVISWWKSAALKFSGSALIVTHDNIIRILVAAILNKKLNEIWKFSLQSTSITIVSVHEKSTQIAALGLQEHLGTLSVDLTSHAL